MPGILDEIMQYKRAEVERMMAAEPCCEVQARMADAPQPRGFTAALTDEAVGVIAEIKRASPSAGVIRDRDFDPAALARQYEDAGAVALSVLTDQKYFGGHVDHLIRARAAVSIPVLCKDFIHRRYQLFHARAAGADAVLLIVAALQPSELSMLLAQTHELGMAALVEVHNFHELALAVGAGVQIIGVNNRDLTSFEVDLSTTEDIAPAVFPDRMLIAESGIVTRADVERLAAVGVDGVLVGTALMRADSPGAALADLIGVPRHPRGQQPPDDENC